MNGSRHGEVITFYSFKGGVGRSMALANVAAIYAQQGKSVLALDFDFEAPGLHRYFLTKEQARYTPEGPQSGVLNLFDALRDRLRNVFPRGQNLEGAGAQSKVRTMVAELLDSGAYKYRVRLKNPNAKNAPPAEVDFIAAARFDATHPELLRAFDWQDFYDDYAEIFPAIVAELKSRYDLVLVDSRTGMTDIGSICTMVLPDKLVLVFTPNEQSLAGALDAGWQAIQGRKEAPEPRELSIFPLVSRVEEGEEEQKRKWIADARERFGRLFSLAYERPEVDLEPYFNVVRIPHKSFYAYGERIAAEEQAVIELGAMAQAFRQLADALGYPDAMQAQRALVSLRWKWAIAATDELLASKRLEMIQTFVQMESYETALHLAEAATLFYEKSDNATLRNAATSTLAITVYVLLCMAKLAWLSDGEAASGALLEKAESKLELANKNLPPNALFVGYQAYVAFLSGRADEAVLDLSKALALGGAKVREALLKAVDTHPLPQDAAFRALLTTIPDPPAGSPPAG